MNMLHITNGDSVAEGIRKAGLEGQVLPWREDYTEGPVETDMQAEDICRQRAQFLCDSIGVPQPVYTANCKEQEAELEAALARGEEIVLWFEHDLFDQTMQSYLLHRIAVLETERALPPLRLQLIDIGSYPGIEPFHGLGQLTPEQLAGLYPGRRPVSAEMLALGRRAWEAYASPVPGPVEALLQADTAALPYLRAAFAAHLERFPSVHDGLGRVERAALQAIGAGIHNLVPLFRAVTGPLPLYGLGDLFFWNHLHRMGAGPRPLIRLSLGDTLPRYGEAGPSPSVTVRLTPDGQDVLEGSADWVKLNGVNRILGGIRLAGSEAAWRWDPDEFRLVSR
jgi:hypothetical protein